MAFDGIVIANLVHDIRQKLEGGKINKIAQPEKDELMFTVKNNKETLRLSVSASASLPLVYFTETNKPSPLTAPNFCMLLRKHIGTGRIVKVSQPGLERIIEFEIEHLDELGDLRKKRLIVELMGKHSNIIFCKEDGTILDSIKHVSAQVSSVREVLPGRMYFIPHTTDKEDPLTISEETFANVIGSTPAPVYSGWRTVGGKTYYYDQYTNQPVTGIQSIDNKLYYFDANGVQQDATFGIDVSKYQSNIDWEQVKTAGVKFVIIRIGYRGYGSGALVLDPMFEQHFTNARNAGLKVGVYFFSQAVNENEAREEAQGCAYVLNGRKLDYPIYFDTEASGGKNGRADGLGVEDRTKCAIAFCEEVKAQGYKPGVYASTLWFRKRIDLNRLKSYSIWNAHYNVAGSPIACDLWQGTCTARIPGYGGQIDVNISYVG